MPENAYIREKKNGGFISSKNEEFARGFFDSLRRRKYSARSIKSYRECLKRFFLFLADMKLEGVSEVTLDGLETYRLRLVGENLAPSTVELYLRSVRIFFRHLAEAGHIFENPAERLALPRPERRILFVPSVDDMKKLLSFPDETTAMGVRDRAILETMYCTGVRMGELLNMTVFRLDLERGLCRVMGKGGKERVVPLGKHAVFWIKKYLVERKKLLKGEPDESLLWVNKHGGALLGQTLRAMIAEYSGKAKIAKGMTPHAIRRACATHMLQNGAHPVEIQMLLGHENLRVLGQYLKLTINEMKATHTASRVGK